MLPEPYWANGVATLYQCDARDTPLETGSIHTVITSPPYFGLRVYKDNDDRGIGLEQSIDEYLDSMMEVFAEVWRVLRDDGVCWVNIGDSYGGSGKGMNSDGTHSEGPKQWTNKGSITGGVPANANHAQETGRAWSGQTGQLLMIPARFALRMQEAGWILRDKVIWAKASPMPENLGSTRWERCRVKVEQLRDGSEGPVDDRGDGGYSGGVGGIAAKPYAKYADCPGCPKCAAHDGYVLRRGSWRCTSSYEEIFQFVKSMGYWSDGEAVKVLSTGQNGLAANFRRESKDVLKPGQQAIEHRLDRKPTYDTGNANRRGVWWDIKAEPYRSNHCPGCGVEYRKKIIAGLPWLYTCSDCEYKLILSPNLPSPSCPECDGSMSSQRICRQCEMPLGSHYATFPPDLPRICIQASTSERGCCPTCGAQWARAVERTSAYEGSRRNDSGDDYGTSHGSGWKGGDVSPDTQTLGWRPSCDCGNDKTVPALVFDPFGGTGTTCLAAQRLGRRSVMTDLSGDYLAQAVARLGKEPLPLGI